MDWGLVLISQGIEATIDYAEDGAGWGLIVAAQDLEPAVKAIRQYKLENRSWPWQQQVFRPGFVFDWGSLTWVVLTCFFFWLNASRTDLQTVGIMDGAAVARGQWWRLFTAIWLHADPAHLAANLSLGVLLLGLAMGRYGTGIGLLAACLAGAGGNLVAWWLGSEPHRSLGASGLVMGCLGLLAAQSFSLWRQSPHARKFILAGLGAGIMLFVLLGVAPGTDVLAHFGGFVSGLLLGALLSLAPALAQKPTANLLSAFLFLVLVVVPWYRALV